MGDAWISLGLAYSELKQYDRAAAAIQKQLDANPFDPRAYRELCGIHQAGNNTDAAITAYARHLEINPLDGATASTLGDLYFDSDQPAKAVPLFEKAASLGSLGAWGYADLGEAYLELNRRDDARRAFEKAIELSPTLPLFRGIAWRLASRREMPDRASELALKAEQLAEKETASLTVTALEQKHLDMMEDVAWTWDALSMIAFQQSRWADAERYGRAAWLLLRDRDTAFRLGEIYEKLDRRADAASYYLTAQALYSDPPADVRAAVKRFVGAGADILKMVETARLHAMEPRTLEAKAADGKGEYLALVGSDHRVIGLKFVGGADAMQQLAEPLKAAAVPLAFPSANATRIAVKLVVGCQAGRCSFIVAPARAAKIEFQVIR